jgi:short-subunit dehydrogenase
MQTVHSTEPTAVVTGASRGIGACIVEALVLRGFRLAAVARDRQRLEEQAARLEPRAAERFVPITADLASPEQVTTLAADVLAAIGSPDVVVHAAGVGHFDPVDRLTDSCWNEMLAVNLTAPFILTRELLPHMAKSGGGQFIYVSSVFEERVGPSLAGYTASKHALRALVECLAQECVDTNIRVSRVVPSSVKTHFGGKSPDSKTGALEAADVAAAVVAAIDADPRVSSSVIRLEGRGQFGGSA